MKRLVLLLALASSACPPKSASNDPASVKAVADVANTVALPAYQGFDDAAARLATSCAALAGDPTQATLTAAKADWKSARVALRKTDAVAFGPIEDLRISDNVDFWPANADALEAWVAGSDALDADAVDAAGANLKGFPALEVLLFTDDEATLLGKLSVEARRRTLVRELGASLAREAKRLDDAWKGEAGYAHQLATPGSGNADFPNAKAAVDTVVNQSYFVIDQVANGVIGKPFGKQNGGVQDPSLERARLSANTLQEIHATLDSAKAVYDGGLGALLTARSPDVATQTQAAWDEAYKRLSETPETFAQTMAAQPSLVESLYQAVRELKNTYGAELATALAVTLRFSDNDGD